MGAISLRDFVLGKKLGDGAFSQVYYGWSKIDQQSYALKFIDHDNLSEESIANIREREITFLRQLHHPNIIKYFGSIHNIDNKTVIITEYFRGCDMYKYVEHTHGLSESVTRLIFMQILSAIEYLHSNLIIHRDLKLENILINPHSRLIKIIDFGLSNRVQPYEFMNTHCGSYHYTAPEVLKKLEYIGPEVDIWSLGCVLYVMIEFKFPWPGDNMKEQMQSIVRGEYIPLSQASQELHDLIAGLLCVQKYDRLKLWEIYEHPWLECSYALKSNKEEIDMGIVDKMVTLGFEREDVIQALEGNYKFTAHSMIYHTLELQSRRIVRTRSDTPQSSPREVDTIRRTQSQDNGLRHRVIRWFQRLRR